MAWDRIRRWEKSNLPSAPRKARGASASALRAIEEAVPDLPRDYLERMRETDGSDSPVFAPWTIAPLKQLDFAWRQLQAWLTVGGGGRTTTEGPVQAVYLHPRWIPFAYDGGGNHLCLDLAPAPGGTVGQVVEFVHDDPVRRVLAPSFTAWLATYADALDAGKLVWDAAFERVMPPGEGAPANTKASLEAISEALIAAVRAIGEDDDHPLFALPSLGVAEPHIRRGFKAVNPKSGQAMVMPASRSLVLHPSASLLRALNPGRKPNTGPNPHPNGTLEHLEFERGRAFQDPDGTASVGWLAAAGLDRSACERALAELIAGVGGRTRALVLPGLGRLNVRSGGSGRRTVGLELSPAARDALNADP